MRESNTVSAFTMHLIGSLLPVLSCLYPIVRITEE